MQVIKKNVEDALFETLKRHWINASSQRCLYLKTSRINFEQDNWQELLEKGMNKFFEDDSAELFFCDDGDIFFLSRYLTKKTLMEMFARLSLDVFNAHPLADIENNLSFLFEINVDWKRIKPICEKKIYQKRLKEIEEEKKELAKKEKAYQKKILDTKLDQKTVDNIDNKREQRENIEVMIVEDDMFSQKLVKSTISKEHTVHAADDGRGAIMTYGKMAPDILFLDIGLPDISGHDVLAKIKEIDPDAYIIMLSGNGDKENVLKAMEKGAQGFVVKPFTQEKLFQYIEKSPFVQKKKGGNNERKYS